MTNQALLDKIILDARQEAESIISIATQQGEEMIRLATEKAQQEEQNLLALMQVESATIFTRRETVARIDVAKVLGRAKLTAVDRAYMRALDKLCAMPREDMTKTIVNLLLKFAKSGDSIRFAKGFDTNLALDILSHASIAHLGLKLLDTEGNFMGGVVIVGDKYDTTLTFETLLKDHRDKHEADILAKLI